MLLRRLACVKVALTGLLEIGKTLPEEDYSKQVGRCVRRDVHRHRSTACSRVLPGRVLGCLPPGTIPATSPLCLPL